MAVSETPNERIPQSVGRFPDNYLPLDLPERFEFQFLSGGTWWGEATCEARQFERLEDGSYVGSAGGSPIYFRCIENHLSHFIHVDGTGRTFVYRLVERTNVT